MNSNNQNRNNLINEFSKDGETLGETIIKLIKKGTVATELPGIIQNIPAETDKILLTRILITKKVLKNLKMHALYFAHFAQVMKVLKLIGDV